MSATHATRKEKRTYWLQKISEWKSSGQSQTHYCKSHELNPHVFIYWKRKFDQELKSQPPLVPVKIVSQISPQRIAEPTGLSLHLQDRFEISIGKDFDSETLGRLVEVLERF